MELGATVCFRQNPLCLTCPLRPFCAAAPQGEPEAYPRLAAKKIEQRAVTRVWCERRGELLLHRAAAGARRFANIYELPTPAQAGLDETDVTHGRLLVTKRRAITRFQITESIYVAAAPRGRPGPELSWVKLSELDSLTLSGPHRRWIAELLARRA